MRKLLTVVAVTAVILTACGTGEGSVSGYGAGDGSTTGINVTGRGRVVGVPDTLTLQLGVSVLRPTVDVATADAAARAQAIIDALKANGVAEVDIQTSNYSIYPEYDYSGNTQRLSGYRVNNNLTVKIRELDKAGAVIDAAAAAGGNDTVVNGLSFSIEDNQDMLAMARTAAWNDAAAKADQLARLAGLRRGAAISITESTDWSVPPVYYERSAMAGDAATPIQPGQQEVVVIVTVTFAIGR